MVKANRLVSEYITASDKAYTISIAKLTLNFWIKKGSSKSAKHGKATSPSVACVSKANSKTDDHSDDEMALAKNDTNGKEQVGNKEDEVAAID
jgi:hypothetical protein